MKKSRNCPSSFFSSFLSFFKRWKTGDSCLLMWHASANEARDSFCRPDGQEIASPTFNRNRLSWRALLWKHCIMILYYVRWTGDTICRGSSLEKVGSQSSNIRKYYASYSWVCVREMEFPIEKKSSSMNKTAAFVLAGTFTVPSYVFKLVDAWSGIRYFSIHIKLNRGIWQKE